MVRERISAGERVVRVAKRCSERQESRRACPPIDIGKGQSSGERLEIRHGIPLIARDAAVKVSDRRADRSFAVAKRIPCEPDSRGNMRVTHRNPATLHAGVAVEKSTCGCRRVDDGLLSRHVVHNTVVRIGRRCLDVPAETQIKGQP